MTTNTNRIPEDSPQSARLQALKEELARNGCSAELAEFAVSEAFSLGRKAGAYDKLERY